MLRSKDLKDKANLGLNGGIEEFNYQINNMQSMMTSWLSDMKEKLYEADTKWKAKQVSFVTQRGEWIEKVRNKQTSQSDDEITALKQKLKRADRYYRYRYDKGKK